MMAIMSIVITAFNVGFVNNIGGISLKAWVFAFIFAVPIIISSVVHKFVALVLHENGNSA